MKHILVIDDEELVTKSLSMLLKSKGYSVTVVKSGKEGIEKVKRSDFDLLIIDVRMPEMDGIETLKQIRGYLEKTNRRQIPEIVISGYADGDKYESALDLEVTDYLSKPFDNNEFLRIVQENIREKH